MEETKGKKKQKKNSGNDGGGQRSAGQMLTRWRFPFYPVEAAGDTWLLSNNCPGNVTQTCSLIPTFIITCTVWRVLVIWRRLSFWGQPHFCFSETIAVNNRITQGLANLSVAWSGRVSYACGSFKPQLLK